MSDEAGILEFSGLDTVGADAVETPVVETPAAEVPAAEVPAADAPAADAPATKEAKQQYNSDGTPKEAVSAGAEDLPGTEKTPAEIRQALKALRDSDPKHAAAVKQLHGAFERYEAVKAIFPGGVNEIKQAKEFLDLVGGHEGLESLQGVKAAAEASDAKLYDPEKNAELISDVVADLKAQGKLENLGNLTSSILDAAKEHNETGYWKAFAPHFLGGLVEVNIPGAFSGMEKALSDPDLASADPAKAAAAMAKALPEMKKISGDLSKWYKEIEANNQKTKDAVVSPERKQLDADRAAFLKDQESFKSNQTTEFKNSVAATCEKHNNKSLGTQLKDFLRMPFFQGFGRENLMPLGNTIKATLYDTLKSDHAYQAQMKAMWSAKTPDRAKIEEYHSARVDSISAEIVRSTVQKMYPGYAKGGAAAGRIAAKDAKTTAVAKTNAVVDKNTAAGKATYVAAKPVWESIDWDKDPKQLLYITGKAYLKAGGRLVTWRK
jgi:hypothetical protein